MVIFVLNLNMVRYSKLKLIPRKKLISLKYKLPSVLLRYFSSIWNKAETANKSLNMKWAKSLYYIRRLLVSIVSNSWRYCNLCDLKGSVVLSLNVNYFPLTTWFHVVLKKLFVYIYNFNLGYFMLHLVWYIF